MGARNKQIKAKVLQMQRPQVLCVTEVERLNLQRLQAEARAAHADNVTKQREANDYLKSIDPEDKFHKLIQAALAAQMAAQHFAVESNAVVDAVSKRLGVDIRKYSIDDDGTLHLLDSVTPQSSPKK